MPTRAESARARTEHLRRMSTQYEIIRPYPDMSEIGLVNGRSRRNINRAHAKTDGSSRSTYRVTQTSKTLNAVGRTSPSTTMHGNTPSAVRRADASSTGLGNVRRSRDTRGHTDAAFGAVDAAAMADLELSRRNSVGRRVIRPRASGSRH
jgi:hypothetical protein